MTSHFVQVNGIRLHYMEEGSGEPVILLHGFPEFWYSWREQIPVLSKHYRVIVPDMRGYNLSDKPSDVSDYRIELLAADIADLVKELGYKSSIIVGHDWGAAVAWAVAAYHPEVVKKLGILNVPHPEEMSRAFFSFNFSQCLKSYYIFFFQLPLIPEMIVGTERFFRSNFQRMYMRQPVPSKEIIDAYVAAYQQPGAVKATIAYYRAAFRRVFDKQEKMPKIKAPVLMLWGEHDKALGKELTYRTKDYCKGPFEIHYDASSGHFIQHDNPEWVNEKLLKFFKS